MSHPPIFRRLARLQDPYGAVCGLARALAHAEPDPRLNQRTRDALDYQRHPRFNNYRTEA